MNASEALDVCPACSNKIWSGNQDNFCSKCGQALKWSDENASICKSENIH